MPGHTQVILSDKLCYVCVLCLSVLDVNMQVR